MDFGFGWRWSLPYSCFVAFSWVRKVFEVWNIAGKFGMEGFYCCLHDIQEDDGGHVVTLLYSCFVVNLTCCFSEFQMYETFQVEFFDHVYHVVWYSILGKDEEHEGVIYNIKGLDKMNEEDVCFEAMLSS